MKLIATIIFSTLISISLISFNQFDKKANVNMHEAGSKIEVNSQQSDFNNEEIDLNYRIGQYNSTTTRKKMSSANLFRDFISGYPVNQIHEYVSVEVIAMNDNNRLIAVSENEQLSEAQQKLIQSLKVGDDFDVIVKYKMNNAVDESQESLQMDVNLSVVPEYEAIFIGGHEAVRSYFKTNSQEQILNVFGEDIPRVCILFIVDKEGYVGDISITTSSKNDEIDDLLMGLVEKMPKWEPAQDLAGKPIPQKFEFSMGMPYCKLY